jgi:hypothetical protein
MLRTSHILLAGVGHMLGHDPSSHEHLAAAAAAAAQAGCSMKTWVPTLYDCFYINYTDRIAVLYI